MELGPRLMQRMKELGLSQQALAAKAGLTQQSISHYVRNVSKPNYDSIVSLADALEVHPIWFFEDHIWDPSSPSGLLRKTFPLDKKEKRPTSIAERQKLVIGHWLPMQSAPSPIQAHSAGLIAQLYRLTFNRLVNWIGEKPHGDLAVDWKSMGDQWMFQLREGVCFHDGALLTVEDVRWSYEEYLARNPQEKHIAAVSVIDEQFIQLHLREQTPLVRLAMPYILPAGIDGKSDWLGTGPFQFVDMQPGHWQLCANPRYFLSKPYLNEIEIREYSMPADLEEALLKGEVQFARGLHLPTENLTATAESSLMRYQVHFMLQDPLVQDVALRKAIASALDRTALAEAVGLKKPVYSSGPFDSVLNDRTSEALLQDPEHVQELVKQMPSLSGSTLRVGCDNVLPGSRLLADAIVEQLNSMGIGAEIGNPPHMFVSVRSVGDLHVEARHWLSNDRYNLSQYSNSKVDRCIQGFAETPPIPGNLIELRRLVSRDMPDIQLFYDEIPFTYVSQLRTLGESPLSLSSLHEGHLWYLA